VDQKFPEKVGIDSEDRQPIRFASKTEHEISTVVHLVLVPGRRIAYQFVEPSETVGEKYSP
jgi:hypothetical protein